MRHAVLALAGLLCLSCATSSAFRAGERAERVQDYDRAVLEYAKAVREHPDNVHYGRVLERARIRSAEAHARTGRRLALRGLYKEASDELRLAVDLNPASRALRDELTAMDEKRSAAAAPPASIEEIKGRARERSFPGLDLGPEAREPLGLSFRGASLREAYQALGKVSGVSFVFDPQFQDQAVTLDLREVGFEQAVNALGSAGRTFHRVVDARVLMVLPDTPNKRRDFEQQVVKTFFLSNADLKETIDLLRVVLGARRVAPIPGSNALTINDTPEKVAAAERIIDVVDKRKAEVVIEVEILEINRSRLKEYGIEIASIVPLGAGKFDTVDGIAGGAAPDPTVEQTLDRNPYRPANIVLSSLPGVLYRLLRTDSSTRLLANPQIRSTEGQTAQARFGDQVPVPVTTFVPLVASGTQQQPITSFEYKNVGVNIDLTPRVHHDNEVTLNLKVEISALGALIDSLPTFNNRTVTSVIRLKDGETTLLAGLIRDDERQSITGIPGLASIPVLGRLFSHNRDEGAETDIVMTLTPHIIHRTELTEEDLRSFQVGVGEASPLLFEPASLSPPNPRPTPAVPDPHRIEPIRPPTTPGINLPFPAPSPTPNP